MLLVTVIVPVYNGEAFIGEALDSALAQDLDGVEVIVVDDGSTDGTREIVKDMAGVQYVWQQNQGPAAARNTALELARGEFVAFLDADDRIPPSKLRTQVGYLRQHPEVGCVLSRHEWMDGVRPITSSSTPSTARRVGFSS